MTNIRAFIALPLPDALKTILADTQRALQTQQPDAAVRWARPEQMHLTLVFLGTTPVARLPAIQAAMDAAATAHAPFSLALAAPGCFPNCRRPRVLWAGLAGAVSACQDLKAALDVALKPLGWPPERRPYTPHLTLGRARHKSRLPALDLTSVKVPTFNWAVDQIHLYESELGPAGPRYTVRHTSHLAA